MTHHFNWSLIALPVTGAALALGCSGGTPSSEPSDETTSAPSTDNPTTDTDSTDDTDTTTEETPPDCAAASAEVGPSVLRRLSKLEYQFTLQDLFQLPEPPVVALIPEDVAQEGFTSFAEAQSVTAGHLRGYWDTATALFDDLLDDPARQAGVLGCELGSAECLQSFVAEFGRLAYRRTLGGEEITSLVNDATTYALDEEDQFRYAAEALLVSPEFLFRLELGDSSEGLSTLNGVELASKLSFTLWGRAPSAELLDRAEAGELDTEAGLTAMAVEMLEDEKLRGYYRQFFKQWLGYTQLRGPQEAPEGWSDELMAHMVEETDALVDEYAWEPGQHFFDALTANHTTVAPALGAYYGVTPNAQGRVEFADTNPRYNAGLLGHGALMSQKTDGDKISVRGNWLRSTFLCESLEIPPEVAATLGEQLVGLTSTEIIAERNTEVSCKKCHSKIDPIGVGLAYFDATGRYDSTVDLATYPIAPGFPDASDPSFTSLAELAAKVQQMPQTAQCLSERLFLYANGRHPEVADSCTSSQASSAFTEEGGNLAAIIRSLVQAPNFRSRRAPQAL
jgi:hypothetical protein